MKTRSKMLFLAALCAVLTVAAFAAAESESVADTSLIRFHVIANSDTPFDQSVKLKVRDKVIEKVNGLLTEAETKEEAETILATHNGEIEAVANDVLKENGCSYRAKGKLKTSLFPTKRYGDLTLPAGKYEAYKVILGEGKGKNWWCVLYPPLCFVDINDDTAVAVTTKENIKPETGDVFAVNGELYQLKIRSKVLDEIFNEN